jgi:hypothetical protein
VWGREREGTTLRKDLGGDSAGAGTPPDASPATAAEQLRHDWLAASVEDGWAEVGEWHQPVVDALVAAAIDRADLRPPAAALAGQRCIFGITLDETLADLAAFVRVAPEELLAGTDRFALARSAALAWYRASVDPQVVQPCRDSMTGLATETHLVVRASEIYQQAAAARQDPREFYELIVMAWDGHERPAVQIGVRIRLAGLFQRSFAAGQTMALIGDGAIVVLTRRDSCPPETLEALERGLDEAMAGARRTKVTRWPFPRTIEDLTDLMVSLHGSADRDAVSRWRDAAG